MLIARSIREGFRIAREIGFPLRLSTSFGTMTPFTCNNEVELARHLRPRLKASPIHEVGMERVYTEASVPLEKCYLVRDTYDAISVLVGPLAEYADKPLEFRVMRWRTRENKKSATVARFISMGNTDRISTLAFVFQEQRTSGYGFVMVRHIRATEAYGKEALLQAAKKSTGPIEFLPSYTLSPPSPWRVSVKKGRRVLEKALRRADKQSSLGIHRIVQVDS
jgi:hypothetical protein